MAQVKIYGKEGCGKCEAAKKTIGERMGTPFDYMDIENLLAGVAPDDWREQNYHDIMAAYTYLDTLPLVQVDNEEITTYPKAVKRLKELRGTSVEDATPVELELAVA